MLQHQELAEGRWFTFSLAEQLGNIGSEVGRAINWRDKGNADQMQKALERGLELFDLTLSDKRYSFYVCRICHVYLFYAKHT